MTGVQLEGGVGEISTALFGKSKKVALFGKSKKVP